MKKAYKTKGGRIVYLNEQQYWLQTKRQGNDAFIEVNQDEINKTFNRFENKDTILIHFPYWEKDKMYDGYGYGAYGIKKFNASGNYLVKTTHSSKMNFQAWNKKPIDMDVKGIKQTELKLKDNELILCYYHPGAIREIYARYGEQLRGRFVVYTMYESTEIPDEWASTLDLADLILVPTQFCKKAFEKRTKKPVEVVPLGFDPDLHPYIDRPSPEVFTFLHYNALNPRKGWDAVLKAYYQEFRENEGARLIMKTIFCSKDALANPIIGEHTRSDIEWVQKVMDRDEQANLLASANCFVFPSRGEGWGYPPIEAVSTGLPAIVTKAHSHLDSWNEAYIGVDTTSKPSEYVPKKIFDIQTGKLVDNPEGWRNTGDWAEPDIASLRKAMRYAFENWQEIKERGKKGREYLVNNLSFKQTNKILGDTLRRFLKGSMSTPSNNKQEVQISYGILSCKADRERAMDLVKHLANVVGQENIYVLYDSTVPPKGFATKNVYAKRLKGDFASHRNYLLDQMPSDGYICMLDGDEWVMDTFPRALTKTLENVNTDVIFLPRHNKLIDRDKITRDDINIDKNELRNGMSYPDLQSRVFKAGIKYEGKIHEGLTNYKSSFEPKQDDLHIIHVKTQKRQNEQNVMYRDKYGQKLKKPLA